MSVYISSVRNPLVAVISNHLDGYPTPVNLSYLWGFGSLSGIALVVQIVTGVCLASHYAPEMHLAFTSVEHMSRDVRGGSALRYIHANGASSFFIVVYMHSFRGLYYGSYFQPRSNLWYSGIVMFFLSSAAAFSGYVLPWGQSSFWGATVITNLFSAIPGMGNSMVQLLWGGFSVDNPTLNRFFSLHYFVPFLIAGSAFLHLILLHQNGSNNPLGMSSVSDRIPFYPYFYVKDLFGFFIFMLFFSFFVIYAPNLLGHPDNYMEANPLVTPAHMVPEWYFLPFYAVLRTIPDKLGGVVLSGLAIAVLTLLPVVDTSAFRSTFFKPLHLWLFWYFFCDSVSLGWIGQEIVESPFMESANFVTLSYFAYFFPLLPLLGFLEYAMMQRQLGYTVSSFNLSHLNKIRYRYACGFGGCLFGSSHTSEEKGLTVNTQMDTRHMNKLTVDEGTLTGRSLEEHDQKPYTKAVAEDLADELSKVKLDFVNNPKEAFDYFNKLNSKISEMDCGMSRLHDLLGSEKLNQGHSAPDYYDSFSYYQTAVASRVVYNNHRNDFLFDFLKASGRKDIPEPCHHKIEERSFEIGEVPPRPKLFTPLESFEKPSLIEFFSLFDSAYVYAFLGMNSFMVLVWFFQSSLLSFTYRLLWLPRLWSRWWSFKYSILKRF